MKELLNKLIITAIILILLMIFIFLFADCKMENEKLRLKIAILQEDNEKLYVEAMEIRKSYSHLMSELIKQNKLSIKELSSSLPEKEFEIFQTLQDKRE